MPPHVVYAKITHGLGSHAKIVRHSLIVLAVLFVLILASSTDHAPAAYWPRHQLNVETANSILL